MVKFFKERIKTQKIEIDKLMAEKNRRHFWDSPCYDSLAERELWEAQAVLKVLVDTKISTEKFMKKLRHDEK